jgi:guanine nucleotide-binding protein subunit beta
VYRHLVSGSLDGKLIIWDSWNGSKIQIIPLKSSWVLAVDYSPSGEYVASGGMDNMVTVYDLTKKDEDGVAKINRELGFLGFLNCCKFHSDKRLLTGSGDLKITCWDLVKGLSSLELFGHTGDVASISLNPQDENVFVTGSLDQTAKLWDLRVKGACQTFWGHTGDINCVAVSTHFHQPYCYTLIVFPFCSFIPLVWDSSLLQKTIQLNCMTSEETKKWGTMIPHQQKTKD